MIPEPNPTARSHLWPFRGVRWAIPAVPLFALAFWELMGAPGDSRLDLAAGPSPFETGPPLVEDIELPWDGDGRRGGQIPPGSALAGTLVVPASGTEGSTGTPTSASDQTNHGAVTTAQVGEAVPAPPVQSRSRGTVMIALPPGWIVTRDPNHQSPGIATSRPQGEAVPDSAHSQKPGGDSPRSVESRPSPRPAPSRVSTPPPKQVVNAPRTVNPIPKKPDPRRLAESIPPVGGGSLDEAQVAYCMAEDFRLEGAKDRALSQSDIGIREEYNRQVDEWLLRCGNFSAPRSVLVRVGTEVRAIEHLLRQDGWNRF